jgi:hypothetical protein
MTNKKLFSVKFYGDYSYYFAAKKGDVILYIIEKEDITEEEFHEDYKIKEVKFTQI